MWSKTKGKIKTNKFITKSSVKTMIKKNYSTTTYIKSLGAKN